MANQSCFITAIAFLKFWFTAPGRTFAGFCLLKLKLFGVRSALQFAVQHGINASDAAPVPAVADCRQALLQKALPDLRAGFHHRRG